MMLLKPRQDDIEPALWAKGFAQLGEVLSRAECEALRSLTTLFFSAAVDMARLRFGRGESKYFSYPLPPIVKMLREHWYKALAPIAEGWMSA